MTATDSLVESVLKRSYTRWRTAVGLVVLVVAGGVAAATATVMRGKGSDAVQSAGQACILASFGLAVLAPELARTATPLSRGVLQRAGAAGLLAAQHLRQLSQEMARALVPIILLTGTGLGTLSMQSIENAALNAKTVSSIDARNVQTLNLMIVDMSVAFLAIMLAATLVGATNHRRREFGQLRLAGMTPAQLLAMLSLERIQLLVVGLVCGTIAAAFTVVSFGIARSGSVDPHLSPLIHLCVAGGTAGLTLTTAYGDQFRFDCSGTRGLTSPLSGADQTPEAGRDTGVLLAGPTHAALSLAAPITAVVSRQGFSMWRLRV